MKLLKTLAGIVPLVMGFLVLVVMMSCDLGTPPQAGGGGGTEVEGIIVDQHGKPVAGVWVRVYPDSGTVVGKKDVGRTDLAKTDLAKQTESFLAIRDSTRTNSNGEFRLPNLPSGTYNLLATVTRNDTTLALFRRSIVVNGNADLGTDTLRVAGSLSLQVVLDGAAIGGALCYIPGSPYLAVSGLSGLCTLTELPPGIYRVSVTAPGLTSGQSDDIAVVSFQITVAGTLNLLQFITSPPTSNDSLWSVRMDSIPTLFIGSGATAGFLDSIQFTGIQEVSLLGTWDNGGSSRGRNFYPGDPGFDPRARATQMLSAPMWGSNPGGTPWSGASARATDARGMVTHFDTSSSWKNLHNLTSKYRRAAVILNFPDSLSTSTDPTKWPLKVTRIVVRKNGAIVLDSSRSGGFAASRSYAFLLEYLNPASSDSMEVYALGDALEIINGLLFKGSMRLIPGAPQYNQLQMTWVGSTTVAMVPAAPTLVSPSSSQTLTGALTLKWGHVSNATSYQVQVSINGTFLSQGDYKLNDSGLTDTARGFTIPATTTYYWRARARNDVGVGPWSTVSYFTGLTGPLEGCVTAAPVLLTPLNGAVNIALPAVLAWDTACGAGGYKIQVATDSAFTTVVATDSTLSTTRTVALSANTLYYWRVASKLTAAWSGWSAARRFSTASPADTSGAGTLSTPTLLTPAAFATAVSTTPTLSWNPVSGASQFDLQVSTSAAFTSFAYNANDTIGTLSKTLPILASATSYYWRVRARSGTNYSAYSEVRTFTTAAAVALPSTPALIAPMNDTTTASLSVNLTWGASTGAASYRVQVSLDSSFSTFFLNDSSLTGTNRSLSGLINNTVYYWRVIAKNSSGTATSSVRKFRTITSTSSTAWTSQASGTTNGLHSVVWTGSLYVAVGENGTIRTSPNGITWTTQVSGTTSNLNAVAWTGSLLVTAGVLEYVDGYAFQPIFTSPNGITWTKHLVEGTYYGTVNSITWSGSELLMTCASNALWVSPDGLTWESGEDFNGDWLSGAYLGNKRLMVGGNTVSTGSGDADVTMNTVGTNLTYVGTRSSSGTMYNGTGFDASLVYGGLTSVTANGNVFVGVSGSAGTTQGTIVTSSNGTTWTTRATGTGMNLVTYTGGKLAAMSTAGKVQTSANDGVTWTEAVGGTSSGLVSVVLGNSQWVAVGAGGKILTAPSP